MKKGHNSLLSSHNSVLELCSPIFNNTEINYFNFARYYKNGSGFTFSSNMEWHEHFIVSDRLTKEAKKIFSSVNNGVFLWENHSKFATEKASREFDIKNPIAIVSEYKDFFEIASFGTSESDRKIFDFYLNNMDILKQFILYFKDRGSPLIKAADKAINRFEIPDFKFLQAELLRKNAAYNRQGANEIIKQIKVSQYFYYDAGECGHLPRRELQCLYLFCRGSSAKEIAKTLGISPKTVEEYLSIVKTKFDCSSRAELIRKAYDIGIHLLNND